MATANNDIREYAKKKDVRMWEIAEKYGLHEGNFSRRLRHELPPDEQTKIKAIIDEIAERN